MGVLLANATARLSALLNTIPWEPALSRKEAEPSLLKEIERSLPKDAESPSPRPTAVSAAIQHVDDINKS